MGGKVSPLSKHSVIAHILVISWYKSVFIPNDVQISCEFSVRCMFFFMFKKGVEFDSLGLLSLKVAN